MANENKQVNYSNFDFFKLDSMSLPEITVGSDAYGSLLNPELNAEDNTEQTVFQTPEMPEPPISETIEAPVIEEEPESSEVIFEQLDQQEQNEVPITTEDLLPVIEDPQEPLVVGDLLPQIEDPQEPPLAIDDLLPQIEDPQEPPLAIDDLLPQIEDPQEPPLAIDDLLPQIEDPQEPLVVGDLLPQIEDPQEPPLAIDDILPPLEDKQEEPLVVTDLLPDINDSVQERLDVSEILPLIETEKEEVLSVSDMLPEENIFSEKIVSLNEYNLEIPEKEESVNISDLLDPIEVQQQEQQRISDLINESNEIIYNQKSSLEIKIKELEAKFTKMDTEALPNFKAAVTAALNMNRDRPVNVKPGYADDIGKFFTKINSPPTWRAMSN